MKALSEFQKTLAAGECAILISPVSRRYLTGFSSSDGVLLVTKTDAKLYLDSRYYEMATLKQQKGEVDSALQLSSASFSAEFALMSKAGNAPVALFEDHFLTVAKHASLAKAYPGTAFVPMGNRIEKMRVVKTEKEIERIRSAQQLAQEAYFYILPRLEVGRSESAIAAELEYYMKLHGASGASFSTICVSGTRTSLPHGTPTDALLQKNSFVTMDFGCLLDGYCSDMTRTVCIGKASEKMRLVYETVLRAQNRALSAVCAGVTGKEVDAAARDEIALAGFGPYFGHSTGHGIGLEVHEAPGFGPRSEEVIPEGAVLSVEPGIYLPGEFGVRIEDLVVVRQGHGENLNTAPKELLEL